MLRPDLVQAAFPTNQPHPQSGNKKEADGLSTAVHSLKDSEPLYYNSLVSEHTKRHLTKPSVKQHLEKHGFIAKDGTVYPTQQEQIEANRANRLLEEKEAILQKVEERERARMERLRQMARAGDIVFTKDGIVETKPCGLCNSYHKVGSLLSPTEPCPGSQLAQYAMLDPLPAFYQQKASRKVWILICMIVATACQWLHCIIMCVYVCVCIFSMQKIHPLKNTSLPRLHTCNLSMCLPRLHM